MIKIGTLILRKRKQLRMTQAELSKKTEIAQSTLSYVESEKGSPIFYIVEQIVTRGFDMSLIDFLAEDVNDGNDINPTTISTVKENLDTYESEKNRFSELSTFGEQLKFLRNFYGVTQDELATILGITRSAYSTYERNLNMPSEKNTYILAKLFDIPLKSLTFDFNELDTSKIIDLGSLNENSAILIAYLFKKLKNSPNLTEDDTEALKNLIKNFIAHLKKIHSK